MQKEVERLGYHVAGTAMSTAEAGTVLKEQSIGMAILDIHLGGGEKDGIWLGQQLRNQNQIPFIYCTAYSGKNMIKRAVDIKRYAYLIKPFNSAELMAAIELAATSFYASGQRLLKARKLMVKEGGKYIKLNFEEIIWVESKANYLAIASSQGMFNHRATVKVFLEILPAEHFVQCHRAFIINRSKVSHYGTNKLTMTDGCKVPVSDTYRGRVMEIPGS